MCQCVVHTGIIYEQNYCFTSINHEIPSLKATVFLEAVLRHFPTFSPTWASPLTILVLANELQPLTILVTANKMHTAEREQ